MDVEQSADDSDGDDSIRMYLDSTLLDAQCLPELVLVFLGLPCDAVEFSVHLSGHRFPPIV